MTFSSKNSLLFDPTTERLSLRKAVLTHWPEYAMEAALLGGFMLSACLFGIVYQLPTSPVCLAISSSFLRRVLMGVSMGLMATALIYSPWGKQSGAHLNPSVTLAFLRLGKISWIDATSYIVAQFAGAGMTVWLLSLVLRPELNDANVRFVATTPGTAGVLVAFVSEFVISVLLMTVVLHFANNQTTARYTGLIAGMLVAVFITFEAPLSGMSMNPARTFGSALPSGIWTAFWMYCVAPPVAMLVGSEIFRMGQGRISMVCAKLHHDNTRRCIHCGANGGK